MSDPSRPPGRRRTLTILGAASLLASLSPMMSAASAQDAPPPSPAPAASHGEPLRERFALANTTHDGRLTRQQAEAGGMKMVARYFDAIDVDHRGYVTLPEIRAFAQAHRRGRPGAAPASPQD